MPEATSDYTACGSTSHQSHPHSVCAAKAVPASSPPLAPIGAVRFDASRAGVLDRATKPGAVVGRTWCVYAIEDLETKRSYVGITQRSPAARKLAHIYRARRDTPVRQGGLLARIREMEASGRCPGDLLVVSTLDTTDSAIEARRLEAEWIERLSTRYPAGYNLMPGGSSLGGPSNSKPVTVAIPGRGVRTFATIQDAIADRMSTTLPVIQPSTVYARLAMGWSAAEALGYRRHQDGRRLRPAFRVGETVYRDLRSASLATGHSQDALRSRLHRASPGHTGGLVDCGTDRRRVGRRRVGLLGLVWAGMNEPVTAEEFARRTGISKATIIHRMQRVRPSGQSVSPRRLRTLLTTATDRRTVMRLELPGGERWTGGQRELIRRLFARPDLEAARRERLSESGIRRRLRLLGTEDGGAAEAVRRAFGCD